MTPELKIRLRAWLEQQGYSIKSIDLLPRIKYRRIVDGELIIEERNEDSIEAEIFSQRGLHQKLWFYEVTGEEGLKDNTFYTIYIGKDENNRDLVYELPEIF